MPVENHPVSEKVKRYANYRYTACQGKARRQGYWHKTRLYMEDGRYAMIDEWIPDTLSSACRYLDHETDIACTGCRQPKDADYINRMTSL